VYTLLKEFHKASSVPLSHTFLLPYLFPKTLENSVLETDGTEHTVCTVPFEMLATHKSLAEHWTLLHYYVVHTVCSWWGFPLADPWWGRRAGEMRSKRCGEDLLRQQAIPAVGCCAGAPASRAGRGS